jgi:hypothetical protein
MDEGPGRSSGWRAWTQRAQAGWRPWLTSRTGGGLITAIVIVALIMTTLPNGRPEPTSEPRVSPGASATPGVTPPPEEAWGDLALPAWEPVAELRPEDVDDSGVGVASAFTLRSRTAAPAAALAAGLTAEPAVAFSVEPGASAAEARVVPTAPLAEGILYRFRLTDPTGALVGSWVYRTEHPLRVVGTVPGNESTEVPLDTGIEIEFDQDGVTNVQAHFSIMPAVAGRFETHARAAVFVPDQPLAPAALYRVTIAAGVSMTGSDQVLEEPVTFSFETATPGSTQAWDVGLGRPILEASPSERPIVALDLWNDDQRGPAPTSLPFEIYHLPSFAAARTAAVALTGQPSWADGSRPLVETDGLSRVAAFDGVFETESPSGYKVIRFPAPLQAGWYLVVVSRQGRDRQALLQVTDLAAFAMTSESRTLAWVNDKATGEPISGADLLDPAGARVGTTGANGLLDVPTPQSLDTARASGYSVGVTITTVAAPDGRRLLLALGMPSSTYAYPWERSSPSVVAEPNHRWWLLLSTDRTTYRSTDTVHAWGLIRSREDRSVPEDLELRLRTPEASSEDGPWLTRSAVAATPRGAWATDLSLDGLPLGSYVLELYAGGTAASSTWIEVAEIRKPAYRIEVQTDRRAVTAGDPVTITARAVFFDGTAAAGLDLRVGAFEAERVVTTDAEGRVSLTLPARADSTAGFSHMGVSVAPAAPEEGEITGTAYVVVYPAAVWIAAKGVVREGRVVIDGSLSRVDLERVERDLLAGTWPENPSGAPAAGGTVTIRVVEIIPVTTQIGTTYDYIDKRAVPVYSYTMTAKAVGAYTTASGSDGLISLAVPVPNQDHSYELTLTSRDAAGRTTTLVTYASSPTIAAFDGPVRPYLGRPGGCGSYSEAHATGDEISLTMHDGDGSISAGGRYLFVVAGRGIRDARLQDSPTLSRTYSEEDLPGLVVLAIRFQDGAYIVTNEVLIQTRLEERTIGVELTADRARYRPGERATVFVRTTDAEGRPIPTDVVLRGVDEKLFSIGQAFDLEALGALLGPIYDGLLQSYASHPVPSPAGGDGCGDTGGGRDDFRDSVLFQLISTGTDGTGSVSFDLPDDLTSWHVSATALASDIRAGSGALLLPVGLPFFADATLASDYLVAERPILRIRSFGDDLAAGDRVRFTVIAPSLLMAPTTVEAAAFAAATVPLPPLALGSHAVTITATVVGDDSRTDTLVRQVVVRASRLEIATTEGVAPAAAGTVGGTDLTTYIVTDAGWGSLIPRLHDLAAGSGARFDRLLAADIARDLLIGTFGVEEGSLRPVDLDVGRYERDGVALLPYSTADLSLTALTAILAPERLRTDAARDALRSWTSDPEPERRVMALAGLAGLGEDVLDDLRAMDRPATQREALWTALGLVAAGDEDGARAIERELLERSGQELGPWIRLDPRSVTDALEATALLALVATAIGDPLAPRIDRYVRDTRSSGGLYVLHQIGLIRWNLDRLPRAAARFSWTVDGARHEETLEPGASWTASLTARQRETFTLQSLEGSIAIVASWTGAPGPGDLPAGDLVTITRTVTPAADAPTVGIVRVTLRIVFSPDAPVGCWDVTDRAPSGLAPLAAPQHWDSAPGSNSPHAIAGQRVSWCIDPTRTRDFTLRYSARVVSAGTFTWEPAVVQLGVGPEIGATTPVTTYTIR